jgi:hypothetical protein
MQMVKYPQLYCYFARRRGPSSWIRIVAFAWIQFRKKRKRIRNTGFRLTSGGSRGSFILKETLATNPHPTRNVYASAVVLRVTGPS